MIRGNWHTIIRQRAIGSCERKAAYPDEGKAAYRACKMSHRERVLLLPYHCIDCGWWHVGHQRDKYGNFIEFTGVKQ